MKIAVAVRRELRRAVSTIESSSILNSIAGRLDSIVIHARRDLKRQRRRLVHSEAIHHTVATARAPRVIAHVPCKPSRLDPRHHGYGQPRPEAPVKCSRHSRSALQLFIGDRRCTIRPRDLDPLRWCSAHPSCRGPPSPIAGHHLSGNCDLHAFLAWTGRGKSTDLFGQGMYGRTLQLHRSFLISIFQRRIYRPPRST